LAVVLSVLQYKASGYPCGIFRHCFNLWRSWHREPLSSTHWIYCISSLKSIIKKCKYNNQYDKHIQCLRKQKNNSSNGPIIYRWWEELRANLKKRICPKPHWKRKERIMWGIVMSLRRLSFVNFSHFTLPRRN
jgi:hypothetical protein